MAGILNNVTTENEYAPKNEVKGGPGVAIEAFIYNNPVFLQIRESATGDSGQSEWQREVYLPPQQVRIPRMGVFGARVRSAVEGSPAQVTLMLVYVDEDPLTYFLSRILRAVGG